MKTESELPVSLGTTDAPHDSGLRRTLPGGRIAPFGPGPMRAELYGLESLEAHARDLAASCVTGNARTPVSRCSHVNVSGSPSASENDAGVSANAVPTGIVRFAPALITGVLFPVDVFDEQLPFPATYVWIFWMLEW